MEVSAASQCKGGSLNSLRLRRIYDIFYKNDDSIITVDEIRQALRLLGFDVEQSELHSTVSSFIKPGNDGLRFEDFEALHRSLNEDALKGAVDLEAVESERDADREAVASREESDLSEAFKVFDEDGDGFISARELQVVLHRLGLPEGREIDRVHEMILSVDRNQDGRVDFFDFKDMMRSVAVHGA